MNFRKGQKYEVMSSTLICKTCGTTFLASQSFCSVCGQPQMINVSLPSSLNSMLPSTLPEMQRYHILEKIGEGGYGLVYKAQDMQTGLLVAIKQITLTGLHAREIIEATASFNREVALLSQLRHDNLPCIYDYFADANHWYIVMEYIKGQTLEEVLIQSRGDHLSLLQVLRIGKDLCEVLDYLHAQRPPIIFRDVKPANIMITSTGRIYLIDFGIARRYQKGQYKDTGSLGSPGYAAPEQYGKAQTTPQTDIYSLGVTLQTLLTGKEPLETQTKERLSNGHTPEQLQMLLEKMMDPDPNQRPANITIVKQSLQNILNAYPSSTRQIASARQFVAISWIGTLWASLIFSTGTFFFFGLSYLIFVLLMQLFAIIYCFGKAKQADTHNMTRKAFQTLMQEVLAELGRFTTVEVVMMWFIFLVSSLSNFHIVTLMYAVVYLLIYGLGMLIINKRCLPFYVK